MCVGVRDFCFDVIPFSIYRMAIQSGWRFSLPSSRVLPLPKPAAFQNYASHLRSRVILGVKKSECHCSRSWWSGFRIFHYFNQWISIFLIFTVLFICRFFSRYDAPQRGECIYSYYTSASTLTICVNPASQFTGKSVLETVDSGGTPNQRIQLLTNNVDDAYYKQNRNLMRCKDEKKRHEFICQGPINIASALGKLPATEHILESFCVDVISYSVSW